MRYLFVLILLSILWLECCKPADSADAPDVSDIEVDFNLIRYDQALFQLDANNVDSGFEKLNTTYPEFTDLYFKKLTNFHHPNKDSFMLVISNFLKDENIQKLQNNIEEKFSNFNSIEKDLKQACQYLKYYFPEREIPVFYTLNSEFGYQSFIFEEQGRDGIGIGLDLFLGEDFNYKSVDPRNPAFSDYLVRTYNDEHIVKKTMEALVKDMIGEPAGKRFLDIMINNGKKLFVLDKILPQTSDTVIIEYKKEDWEWVNENELEIWSFFLEKKMTYETNYLKINKYLNPSPNSPGMPAQAPGKTANFIGWKIVSAFMKRNPEVSLQELIDLKDSQQLLEKAKYKPKRR